MLVTDASVIVAAITGGDERAERIRDRLDGADELAAPHLIDLELMQALRRIVRHGHLTTDRAEDAVENLTDLALNRFPHEPFIDRIWKLRDRLSAYDAAYLALAEAIGIPLITCDAALAVVARESVEVEFFPPEG